MQAPGSPLEPEQLWACPSSPLFAFLPRTGYNNLSLTLAGSSVRPPPLAAGSPSDQTLHLPCPQADGEGRSKMLERVRCFQRRHLGGGACGSAAPGTKPSPSVDLGNCLSLRVPLSSSFLWILLFSHSTNKGYLLGNIFF